MRIGPPWWTRRRSGYPSCRGTETQHYGHFLFAIDPPIDFTLSSAPRLAIDRSATWVAESMLRAFIAPSLEPLAALLDRLVAASSIPVVVVGTPPPKGDEASVRTVLAAESYFVHLAQARGTDLATAPLTPVSVLLKLWLLSQDMQREIATAAGAIFVPVPDRLRDDDGFLLRSYWSTDVTHADADFGQQMMIEVAAVVRPIRLSLRSTRP